MLTILQGDVTATDAMLLFHGVNCRGVMGSGVAKSLREKWPEACSSYFDAYDSGQLAPGRVIQGLTKNGRIVLHLATQDQYLPRGQDHFEYNLFPQMLNRVRLIAQANQITKLACPKIGAGLCGGNWPRIQAMLAEKLSDFELLIYELK